MVIARQNMLRTALFVAILFAFAPSRASAQQGGQFPPGMQPREAVGGILMAGLVGGILGLSTLSFYERPQDNIRNITIGAGIGMIAAALYLTYNVSQVAPPPAKAWNDSDSFKSIEPSWILLPDYDPAQHQATLGFRMNY